MAGLATNRFNFIYRELVQEPNDLVGLLAYSIYKQEKIEYIAARTHNNNGVPPTPEDLADFHLMSMGRCAQYRSMAEKLMEEFQQGMLDHTVQALDEQYKEELNRRIKNIKPKWWGGVLQSFVGSVLYTIFIGVIVVLIIGARSGISEIVKQGTQILGGS